MYFQSNFRKCLRTGITNPKHPSQALAVTKAHGFSGQREHLECVFHPMGSYLACGHARHCAGYLGMQKGIRDTLMKEADILVSYQAMSNSFLTELITIIVSSPACIILE